MWKIFQFRKLPRSLISAIIFSLVFGGLGFIFFAKAPAALALPNSVVEDTWAANGTVRDIHVDGETIYIGGDFTQVGYVASRGALVNTSTGGIVVPRIPDVNGDILTVAPDGSGNWYIGGSFTSVGGSGRLRAAKINSDGTLNSAWNPAPNGTVRTMVVVGSTVYVGGAFSSIGGAGRSKIAALNNTNGNVTS